ncbi:acyl carrier protein [Vagococcus salmoninarum]|uniref:Acyl carrier protein n=1 Tax=Vagococcus salmoninarum TaxID=2739 RepID=A0A429ZC07_9ENTE|nr:acyl carrier protein [Vagococcus salmoninarum]RST91230.1 acyl carrier protein [Vagococcus salmoninarum]
MAAFEKIQEIIVDQLGKEEEEVTLTTNFREELEADSLDLFQIINDIEDEFDVKIETDEGLNTVKDLVDFVEKQLAEK